VRGSISPVTGLPFTVMETATVWAPFWAAVDAAMGASSSKNSGQMVRFAGKSRSPAKFRGEIWAFSPFFVPFNDYYSEPQFWLRSRRFLGGSLRQIRRTKLTRRCR
jgi:hypothetical protein